MNIPTFGAGIFAFVRKIPTFFIGGMGSFSMIHQGMVVFEILIAGITLLIVREKNLFIY